MSRRFSKFIQLGIVGIWLCLVLILVYRHYIAGAEMSSLQSIPENQFRTSEEWFGIYAQNTKIGHFKSSSEKIGNEYRFTQQGETDFPREGESVLTSSYFTCLTDLDFRIKSFEFESRSGETFYKSRGELDRDNMLLLFMETEKQKKTEALELKKQVYLPIMLKHVLAAQGLEKGKRFTIPVLNLFSLKVEDTVTEVEDLIPVKVGINVNTAYRLKIGGNYSWVTDGGITLKEQYASGLFYYAEPEDRATSKDLHYLFDFLSIPVLKANKHLPNPEHLSQLRFRISGIDLSRYPELDEGRQTLTGDMLTIKKEEEEAIKEATYDLPYGGEEDFASFLSPTSFVQSDHHTIVYNAKKFVAIEKNAFMLARYLTSNLYLTVKKMPMTHLSRSMDVFNNRAGESNEHTLLFTAFARAGGLPTRMAAGLVYLKGHFYYHAWPEVWFDRWVPADPTMGQFPADATHIRFVTGDIERIGSFGSQIKNITVEIVEAP